MLIFREGRRSGTNGEGAALGAGEVARQANWLGTEGGTGGSRALGSSDTRSDFWEQTSRTRQCYCSGALRAFVGLAINLNIGTHAKI